MVDTDRVPLRRRLLPWRAARYPGPTHSEIGLPEEPPVTTAPVVVTTPTPPPTAGVRDPGEPPWPAGPPRHAPLLNVNALLARRWGISESEGARSGAHRSDGELSAPPTPTSPRLLDHLVLPAARPLPPGGVGPVLPSSPRL